MLVVLDGQQKSDDGHSRRNVLGLDYRHVDAILVQVALRRERTSSGNMGASHLE